MGVLAWAKYRYAIYDCIVRFVRLFMMLINTKCMANTYLFTCPYVNM